MNKQTTKMANRRLIAVLVFIVIVQQPASGLQVEKEFFTTLRPTFLDGNQDRPLVNVDRPNSLDKKVDVHIPLIFDMTNDKSNSKLDLSVLGGLVTVNRDRPKQPNGLSSGPLSVTVFGIPVYTGVGGDGGALARISDFFMPNSRTLTDFLTPAKPTPSSSALKTSNEQDTPIVSTVKKANERVLQSLASTFGKFSTFVTEATPIVNTNGQPADKSHGFVAPSKFSESDFKPKIVARSLGNKTETQASDLYKKAITVGSPTSTIPINTYGRSANKSEVFVNPLRLPKSDSELKIVVKTVGNKTDKGGDTLKKITPLVSETSSVAITTTLKPNELPSIKPDEYEAIARLMRSEPEPKLVIRSLGDKTEKGAHESHIYA